MRTHAVTAVALAILVIPPVAMGQSADGTWSELAASGPPPRWGHVMIYDPPRDRLLLHGGWNAGVFFDDLWEFPLTTDGPWHRLDPVGPVPSGRTFHSAIYDPIFDRMLIYGGYQGTALGDVWALDLGGETLAWHAVVTTGTPPAARYWHSAGFNDRYGRMTVFGGTDGSAFFDDTPELELRPGTASWKAPVQPVGNPPAARCCHEAIFVDVVSRLVVFGGWNGSTELGDLWELPYAIVPSPGWQSLSGSGAIGARTDHVAVFDRVRNRMVVHGGVTGLARLGDVWAVPLAGPYSWQPLRPQGMAPEPRGDHAAAYDPVRDRMLVFGGNGGSPSTVYGDLWALTWGANTAFHVTCSKDATCAPGDTVLVSFDTTNPFAAPTEYQFRLASERQWPDVSVTGSFATLGPVSRFEWNIVVPDTAAAGTNEIAFHVWVRHAPVLVDSCRIRLTNMTVPTLVSLIESRAISGEVRLAWYSASGLASFTLLRKAPDEAWQIVAPLVPDGTGRIAYIDRAVRPGNRFGYRLVEGSQETPLSEVWIDVPAGPEFALHRAWYESHALRLDVSLAAAPPARIDLMDPTGRRVLTRSLAAIQDEHQQVTIPCDLPQGIYFARLAQRGQSATSKVLVLK